MLKRKNSPIWNLMVAICLVIGLFWTFFPIYWMVVTSLKENLDVFNIPSKLWPDTPTLNSYKEVFFGSSSIIKYFINSIITSLGTVLLAILVSILAGYALSRLRFRFRKSILSGVLVIQMFPLVVLLIPLYLFFIKANLLNSYLGLILAFSTFTVPFGIWIIKGFVDTVPIEIEEAAKIDGCNRFQMIWKVVLPLIIPGIISVAVLAFMDAWNNLLFPLILTSETDMNTVTSGMTLAFTGELKNDWSGMMAASTSISVPVVLVFIFLQRYFIRGLTGGSVKG